MVDNTDTQEKQLTHNQQMNDIVSAEVRSRMMAGIRGKNTKPEMLVRQLLYASGFRYRLHRRDLPGAPDIVLPRRKIAIFVHGCFWHQHENCRYAKLPRTRPEFWEAKLKRNAERDKTAVVNLNQVGWRVLLVWECATRTLRETDALQDQLQTWIDGDALFGEISGAAPLAKESSGFAESDAAD